MAEKEKKFFKLHSIKLIDVGVEELYIKANEPPDVSVGLDELNIPFTVGHSNFDEENRQIAVMVKVEVGIDEDAPKDDTQLPPFCLRVAIIGNFMVGEEFPAEHIDNWARRNAPFIIMPYVREHVYALTSKCGFKPIVLPLLEVPTLSTECQVED